MLNKLFAIAKNTFTEALRQPVYAIIIIAALIMFFISPSITMYTMDDDNKMLREIGLSTIFLSGLFIAIFTATGAITEEIDSKTVITVLSKPVPRPIFIFGKFLGIAAAVLVSHYLLTIAHFLMLRHGVLETASDTHDWSVISLAFGSVLIACLLGTFMNYFYDWKFTSTATIILTIAATLAIAILIFIDRDWKYNPANNNFALFDLYASALLFQAVMVLVAIAVMLSTRFNIIITLTSCIAIFLLGLINDYLFGKAAETAIWAKIARAITPNFQIFWITDAIYEGVAIQAKYILISSSYAIFYIIGILFVAIAMFQRRQVG